MWSHFTCNTHTYTHTEPRLCPSGAELSLTDGLSFTDSYILICFPSHTHTGIRAASVVFHSRMISFWLAVWSLDGTGEAGLDHNTHHMSLGNHREQNKVINSLPAASTPNSFTPKWPQIHSSRCCIDTKILKRFQLRTQMRNLFVQ